MNRRKAQLLLLAIMVPIVLTAAYNVVLVWYGYPLPIELVLTVGGAVFVEAFLATFMASKRGKKKP